VFDHDFEDFKRGVRTHTPEGLWRGGRLGRSAHLVQSVAISPERLYPPRPGWASQQLGATPERFSVPDEELFRLSPEELWKITIEATND
jgi:hypothetical protein